jgi:cephalosporin hydroxylase
MSISGHFVYKGLTIMQHPNIESTFENLLSELKPSKVLEIGTSSGGLTLMIRDILDRIGLESSKLVTYDVYDPQYLRHHVENGAKIDIRVENIFNHQYSDLKNGQEITDFISSEGTTLVLCDGGSKKNEFRIISPLLKSGDVIMAHDYCPNSNYFETNMKNKVWNWMEIQDSDIEDTVSSENLKPYMFEEFLEVAWVCKVK